MVANIKLATRTSHGGSNHLHPPQMNRAQLDAAIQVNGLRRIRLKPFLTAMPFLQWAQVTMNAYQNSSS